MEEKDWFKFIPYKNITFEEVVLLLSSIGLTIPEDHVIFKDPKYKSLQKYFTEKAE